MARVGPCLGRARPLPDGSGRALFLQGSPGAGWLGAAPVLAGLARQGGPCFAADNTAESRSSSSCGATVRRSSRQWPADTRPTTGGSPVRSSAAYAVGRLSATLGSTTPGAPPPPTVEPVST